MRTRKNSITEMDHKLNFSAILGQGTNYRYLGYCSDWMYRKVLIVYRYLGTHRCGRVVGNHTGVNNGDSQMWMRSKNWGLTDVDEG